jgi:hypothetical protein
MAAAPSHPQSSESIPGSFRIWRWVHLIASGLLGGLALLHSALTFAFFSPWSAGAVWFLGTGLGLLLLAALNFTHVGSEPCRRRTTRLIRSANWLFAVFGVSAVFAVPEPQAYALLAGLIGQALASHWTLPGPA